MADYANGVRNDHIPRGRIWHRQATWRSSLVNSLNLHRGSSSLIGFNISGHEDLQIEYASTAIERSKRRNSGTPFNHSGLNSPPLAAKVLYICA
jgi:hypothetical protein